MTKILDLLYQTRVVNYNTEYKSQQPITLDVIAKCDQSFATTPIQVISDAPPGTITIEGPVTVMTGFHTFRVSFNRVYSVKDIELRVTIPYGWLKENEFTSIRTNYEEFLSIEEYAEVTNQIVSKHKNKLQNQDEIKVVVEKFVEEIAKLLKDK